MTRSTPLVAAMALIVGLALAPVNLAEAADAELTLLPGLVEGNINPYKVKRGDYLNALGVVFKLNPIRITKPSKRELANGMSVGETIYIDQRRVKPAFAPHINGVVLNLPEAHVYLVKAGKLVRDYPVGVSTSDNKAPIGRSQIVNMTAHPIWYVPISIQKEMAAAGREVKTQVAAGPGNPLGTRWIGFANGSFGFHGTTSPTSIKRYASHGCVRFLRDDIEDLYRRVYVGMPVRVIYQPVTLAVDRNSVWLSAYPDYYSQGYDYRGQIKLLAKRAGVLEKIHWASVEKALKDKDGILVDIGQPLSTKPLIFAPSPVPTRSPVVPSTSPLPSATPSELLPSAFPTGEPWPLPTPSLTPSEVPTSTPTPSATPSAEGDWWRPPGFPTAVPDSTQPNP